MSVVVGRAGPITMTASKVMGKCPKSALARERTIPKNCGQWERKAITAHGLKLKRDLIRLRIDENEFFAFTSCGNHLKCLVCKCIVSESKQHVSEHKKTKKHEKGLARDLASLESDQKARDFIAEYFNASHAEGETIDIQTMKFRFDTLTEFLRNGTPLNKLDGFRAHYEKLSGLTLTAATHMRQYLLPLLKNEIQNIVLEINGQKLMVIFDGTTRVDEVFAIIFRWVTDRMVIMERLVEMGKYQHSFNHEDLVTAVVKILIRYNVSHGVAVRGKKVTNGDVIAFQRDRCSVNTAAVTVLTRNCIGSKDLECMSHTLTHIGEHMSVPTLLKVKQDVCALTKESYSVRDHWLKVLGFAFEQPGNTRWWAFYKVYCAFHSNWKEFLQFIRTAVQDGNAGESGARINRLLDIINNPVTLAWLKLEVDVVVVSMKPFVEATYILEGKGPCGIIAYDMIQKIESWYSVHLVNLSFPGLDSSIDVCWSDLLEAKVECTRSTVSDYVRGIISPGYAYFKSRIFGMLKEDLELYEVLRYANPIAMIHFRLNFDTVKFVADIKKIDHFSPEVINMITTDLNVYLQLVGDIPSNLWEQDEMEFAGEFWKNNAVRLRGFVQFARYAFTIVTSSAAAERAFSVLKRSFRSEQRLALEDYVMLSCMLQTNRTNN